MSEFAIEIGKKIMKISSEYEKREIFAHAKDDAIMIINMFLDKIERYMQHRVREDFYRKGMHVYLYTRREIDDSDIEHRGLIVKWVIEISVPKSLLENIAFLEAYYRKALRNYKLILKYKHRVPTTKLDELRIEHELKSSGTQDRDTKKTV